MDKSNPIITVGRQFGSGGRIIGKKLAEHFGIAFYDKELINRASEESGISGEFFEKVDEQKKLGGFLSALTMGFMQHSVLPNTDFLSSESLFGIQSETIRRVAAEGPCVLVGRCADYILREHPNRVDLFISAADSDRIRRIMDYNQVGENEAQALIEKVDKSRAAYYNYYTNKTWGAAASYHLCLNSSVLGVDMSTDYIVDFIRRKMI